MASDHIWRLRVHVQPRARHTRIVGQRGDVLNVQVRAAPVDGAANAAVIDVLAHALGLPRPAIRVIHGKTRRHKLVEVETSDPQACQKRLAALLRNGVDKAATCD